MNSTTIEIKVPAAVTALPLTISEEVILTRIDENPDCIKNGNSSSPWCLSAPKQIKQLSRILTP
jgi:hypothetical protein